MDEIKIKFRNCRNIKNGEIIIYKNVLNVKYANNGTGKSTIAEAIKYCIENNKVELNLLKTHGVDEDPNVLIEPSIKSVEIFNEDFVKNMVFDRKEAIKNSFDVFIRTPEFDKKRKELDENLKVLKTDIKDNEDINKMTDIFNTITRKITFNKDGKISKRGIGKDITNTANVYNLPDELKKFKTFIQDDNRVNWIDWKSKGHTFDNKGICPFCTEPLDIEIYPIEKKIFEETYNKNMVKNQKELEDYLLHLKPYINTKDYERIYGYTRIIHNEEDFCTEFKRFCDEANYVSRKISDAVSFDTYDVDLDDLDKLDKKLKSLLIYIDSFKIFTSKKAIQLYNFINNKINILLEKVNILQKEFKEINMHIQNAIRESENDINSFLETAGINYRFQIDPTSETTSKAELKYCGDSGEIYDVEDLGKSLSWGEKNSISLILFMYYALQKEADLIVLDDPVSSFDINKKFAILNRLFNKYESSKTFRGKTVLLLTHDLEPLIDIKTKKYFRIAKGNAWYLTNINGILSEAKIDVEKDLLPTTLVHRSIFENKDLDIVLRLAALRKYLEYTEKNCIYENMPYNIISSLIKGRTRSEINIANNKKNKMGDDQYEEGCQEIKNYLQISDFDYEYLLNNEFLPERLIDKYESETNSYFKLQLFRAYYEREKDFKKELKKNDPIIKKFADESFHIENDYSHCLDYRKFDIVPDYVMKRIDEYMDNINVCVEETG